MPQTITRTVYTYKELKELREKGEIKAEALDKAKWKLFEMATDDDFWYESCFNDWQTALKQIGFPEADLRFSGFSSQGDGASFTCKYVDLTTLLKFMSKPRVGDNCVKDYIRGSGKKEEDFRNWLVHKVNGVEFDAKFRRLLRLTDYMSSNVECIDHHYCHWNTCRFRLEFDDYTAKRDHPRLDMDITIQLVNQFEKSCEVLRKDISQSLYRHLEEDYNSHQEDDYLEEFAAGNNYTFLRSGKLEME